MKGAASRRLNVLPVRCLSPSEVLHNEIYRLTFCFVSCSSGSCIKYILFLVCKGAGRGGVEGPTGVIFKITPAVFLSFLPSE